MKRLVIRLAKSVFSFMGLQVNSKRALAEAKKHDKAARELRRWQVLADHSFVHILDIGANVGQFATLARQIWPMAKIDSFEPLPDVYLQLEACLANCPKSRSHRIALGRSAGSVSMQQSDFSPSSSILPMADLHLNEWPESKGHRLIEVPVERLDDWADRSRLDDDGPKLVKIDVQGYELEVIEGGLITLRRADWLVVEVSFYELYAAQPLFAEIHDRLKELGFVYRGNVEQYQNKAGNRVLFADAIFENVGKCRGDY